MVICNVAILVSGKGTNALNIIEYFEKKNFVHISVLISNNASSLAVKKAQKKGVNSFVFNNDWFKKKNVFLNFLASKNINFIVLAGFLQKLSAEVTGTYKNKIINLHPSLLPRFGGKGMYGAHVHRAVIESGEKETGISIHFVNEEYDKGVLIYQHKIDVSRKETITSLSKKIQKIEHQFFPKIIEKTILNTF